MCLHMRVHVHVCVGAIMFLSACVGRIDMPQYGLCAVRCCTWCAVAVMHRRGWTPHIDIVSFVSFHHIS